MDKEKIEILGIDEILKDTLEKIDYFKMKKGWSEYRLAYESGLTQSTISSWNKRKTVPSISSLYMICKGLGITMSQFFAANEENCFVLTDLQKEILDGINNLPLKQQESLAEFLKSFEGEK